MREIKFRAWDRERGLFISSDDNDLATFMEWYVNEAPIATVLQQYTGLKDKNGVEIYEGDILQCDDRTADYQLYAKVYWDSDEAIYKADRTGDGETCEFELWGILQEHEYIDVIGSIYKNPRT